MLNRLRHIFLKFLSSLTPRATVRSRGLSLTLPCDNWITDYRVRTFNSKEPEMLDWIDRSVRNGDVVFDIGANIGLYTLYTALRHPRCSVVSFEPEYSNLHLLRDNIAKNQVEERVKVFSICLGKKTGPTMLHVQDLTPGAALHSESEKTIDVTHSGKPVVFREGVWSVTLDDFVASSGLTPNCIKLDVDGTEAEILEGGAQTLRSQNLRTIIMEIAEDATTGPQCERLMAAAGFSQKLKVKGTGTSAVIWEKQSLEVLV